MGELICGIVAFHNMKGKRHRKFWCQNQVGKYKGKRFIITKSVTMIPWLQLQVLESSHNNVPFCPFVAINIFEGSNHSMGTFINKH
jgi:hypothetical protein